MYLLAPELAPHVKSSCPGALQLPVKPVGALGGYVFNTLEAGEVIPLALVAVTAKQTFPVNPVHDSLVLDVAVFLNHVVKSGVDGHDVADVAARAYTV